MERQHSSLGDDEARQATQAKRRRLVLSRALVANSLVAEWALDHMERVLDFRADAGFELLGLLEQTAPTAHGVKSPALAWLHRHVPVRFLRIFTLVHAAVAHIAEGVLLIAVQQRASLRRVVDVGRPGDHRLHKLRLGIHADV